MANESAGGSRSDRAALAKWLSVALLAVIAGCLLAQATAFVAPAEAQVPPATQGRFFAVAGQVTADSYGLYLVDTDTATVSVYQYLPNTKKLRLMAVRNVSYDLQLEEYNTEPSPREMKKLVEEQRRPQAATTQPQ
jgi:hypothetical protein